MRKLALYGVVMGLLFLTLEILNFKTLIRQVSLEVYGVLVGIIFLSFGIWLGLTTVQRRQEVAMKVRPLETNLSEREYDVLQLMSEGKSNKEIADQLFVSLNTINCCPLVCPFFEEMID